MFNYTRVEGALQVFSFLDCEKPEFVHSRLYYTVLLPFTAVESELPPISQHSFLQELPGYFPWSHEKAFRYTNVVFPTIPTT